MHQIYDRVAGLDVHRDNVVACYRRLGPRGGVVFEKERFATTTVRLRELAAWLAEREVELVAMEATGVYWKPVYYALESKFTVWLCNARNVKKVWISRKRTGRRLTGDSRPRTKRRQRDH